MNNSKSGLVGILSFIALTAASLGFLGAASRTASASQPARRAPVAVVRDAAEPTVSFETVVAEVTVEGRVPARKADVKPAVKAEAPAVAQEACYVRALGDGNDTSVRTCTPVALLGTAAL